ncbi:hypothetical protein [Streptococcus marmotae]|uniref:hypothetical protein n=1 Tax=Streptococcus marmotae TaxID=1825069 RepID=UPI0008306A49|nr:hypothetical protein [Streptococcus marmotae]
MKRKRIKVVLLVLSFLTMFIGSRVSAGFETHYQTLDGHSLVGLHVLNVTFHASGYSNSNSGSVTNMYFTDWTIFPNTISNRSTWKSSIPYGERANGSVIIGAGVNSPWGAVNLWEGQHYFSIDF